MKKRKYVKREYIKEGIRNKIDNELYNKVYKNGYVKEVYKTSQKRGAPSSRRHAPNQLSK